MGSVQIIGAGSAQGHLPALPPPESTSELVFSLSLACLGNPHGTSKTVAYPGEPGVRANDDSRQDQQHAEAHRH